MSYSIPERIDRFVKNRELAARGITACVACGNHWGVVKAIAIPFCGCEEHLKWLVSTNGYLLSHLCTECFGRLDERQIVIYCDRFVAETQQEGSEPPVPSYYSQYIVRVIHAMKLRAGGVH